MKGIMIFLPNGKWQPTSWAVSTDILPGLWPQNFQIIKQEKTLTLARVLQACAEVFGTKWGILYRAIRELQQCMAPLVTINGDDVMEASMLRPVGEESGPSPTLEEETTLLGKGNGLSGIPGPAPLQAEIPNP